MTWSDTSQEDNKGNFVPWQLIVNCNWAQQSGNKSRDLSRHLKKDRSQLCCFQVCVVPCEIMSCKASAFVNVNSFNHSSACSEDKDWGNVLRAVIADFYPRHYQGFVLCVGGEKCHQITNDMATPWDFQGKSNLQLWLGRAWMVAHFGLWFIGSHEHHDKLFGLPNWSTVHWVPLTGGCAGQRFQLTLLYLPSKYGEDWIWGAQLYPLKEGGYTSSQLWNVHSTADLGCTTKCCLWLHQLRSYISPLLETPHYLRLLASSRAHSQDQSL